jgi:YVTN family beta-propeller protein
MLLLLLQMTIIIYSPARPTSATMQQGPHINDSLQYDNSPIRVVHPSDLETVLPPTPKEYYHTDNKFLPNENPTLGKSLHYPLYWKSYQNPDLGVETEYPSDWKKTEDSHSVNFSSPLETYSGFYQANISISVRPSDGNKTLNQIANEDLHSKRQELQSSTKLSLNDTHNDNKIQADKLVYSYHEGKVEIKGIELLGISGEKIYRIGYLAEQSTFDYYLRIFQKMLYSFKLIEFGPKENLNFITFKKTSMGVYVSYPSKWEGKRWEGNQEIGFELPNKASLSITEYPSDNNLLNVAASHYIEYLKSSTIGLNIIDLNVTTLAGHPAYKVVFLYPSEQSHRMEQSHYIMLDGGKEYVVQYIAEVAKYFDYWQVIQRMIGSLRINVSEGVGKADHVNEPGIALSLHGTTGKLGLAINPNTSEIYVTDERFGSLNVIYGHSNQVMLNTMIDKVGGFENIAINPNSTTDTVYLADAQSKKIYVLAGSSNETVGIIPLDHTPSAITVDTNSGKVFVAYRNSSVISVIDGTQIINNIENKSIINPSAFAVDPKTNTLYVTSKGCNPICEIKNASDTNYKIQNTNYGGTFNSPSAMVVDPIRNIVYVTDVNYTYIFKVSKKLIIPVPVPVADPHASLAVNPITGLVYVANRDSNTISVINGSTTSTIDTITVGETPSAIAVDPRTNLVYLANQASNTISVINGSTNTILFGDTAANQSGQPEASSVGIKVASNPFALAFNNVIDKLYVTNTRSNTVSVIDGSTNKLVDNITVGSFPYAVAIDQPLNTVYVANKKSNSVSVIDGSRNVVVDNIGVEKGPVDIAIDQSANRIYVANYYSDSVSVIEASTNTLLKNIKLGPPHNATEFNMGIALDPFTNTIYVADADANAIYLIDGATYSLVDQINVFKPTAVAVDPESNLVYVIQHSITPKVSVLDASRDNIALANITVDQKPNIISIDQGKHKVYVSNSDSNTVSVINSSQNEQVATVSVGNKPAGIAIDEIANVVYVANSMSNIISAINSTSNNILAGVSYDINPQDSGEIYCNDKKIQNTDYVRYDVGTELKCEAFSKSVFPPLMFNYWSGDYGNGSDKNPVLTFRVSHYGKLISNFKELIPPDYLNTIFGAILAVALPTILGAVYAKRKKIRKIFGEHTQKNQQHYGAV